MLIPFGVFASSAQTVLVTDSLQILLDAGNTASYSGSGTTWNDLAGGLATDNSSLVGGTSFVSAGTSSYFNFDGINDGIQLPNNSTWSSMTQSTSFTIGVWAYIDPSETNGMIFSLQACNDPTFQIIAGDGTVSFRVSQSVPTSENNYRGRWINAVLSYNGSTRTVNGYINGVNVANITNTTNYTVGTTEIWLGRRFPCANTDELFGRIAHFVMYKNKNLSQAEIQQNFNALRGRYGV
jgi:hypothetical protein